jgi:hypothetical protein
MIIIPVEDVVIDKNQIVPLLLKNTDEEELLEIITDLFCNPNISYTFIINVLENGVQAYRDGLVSWEIDERDIEHIDRYSSILLNKMETTIEEYGFK